MCIFEVGRIYIESDLEKQESIRSFFAEMSERMARTHEICVKNGKHSWDAGRPRESVPGKWSRSYKCSICSLGASHFFEENIDMREHWDAEIAKESNART